MLVDVVSELAADVLRPAAADADVACAAPVDVLRAANEIGLSLLGVPEALGGISEERAVMAGALVAEALAKGDLGLAVATLAPGAVATAMRLPDRRQGSPEDAIAAAARDWRAVVVLDNCEHVIEAAARLAEFVTDRCG